MVLLVLTALVAVAALVGYLFHRPGASTTALAFVGAVASVQILVIWGVVYQAWARAFWGAPFDIGDRLRIVRGDYAGTEGRVARLGQGVTVVVEFNYHGELRKEELPWGSVRRIDAVSRSN